MSEFDTIRDTLDDLVRIYNGAKNPPYDFAERNGTGLVIHKDDGTVLVLILSRGASVLSGENED